MTSGTGFGKVQTRKKSASADKRANAAKQYENMKADGLPEFNIYIRIQDKKNWFPVGSLAVNRSSKIHQAIFDNEEELLKGGIRLFPILRKHQQQLEYGYRLKGAEYAEDPIELAVRPQEKGPNLFQGAIAQVTQSFSSLFKRN